MTREAYDYVIVGAGSAGCVLANKLTRDPGVSVLLLEAGGWDRDVWIRVPLGWGILVNRRLHDWGYYTEPDAGMEGREVECNRGKVIGGSSSINAMAYVRGHKTDYDRWAASGLTEWSYDKVLPYFIAEERWAGAPNEYHGTHGELGTQPVSYADPIIDAVIKAGATAGYGYTDDYNGRDQEGFALLQQTIQNGRRCSASIAWLHPVLHRKNLHVTTRAMVTSVQIDGSRAVGVSYLKDADVHTAAATREVLLCGGVINSPQLLMLSGIGNPEQLRQHGIPVRCDLKGVGENLQDQAMSLVQYKRSKPGPLHKALRLDRIVFHLARAYLFGTGFATDLPSGYLAFLKTRPSLGAPDLELLSNLGPFDAGPYLWPFKKSYQDKFSILPVVLRPTSRGRVSLRSNDPLNHPRIFQNFLATDYDKRILREGIKIAREVGAQPSLRPFIAAETDPGRSVTTDAQIDEHVARTSITSHHPLGTCRMGLQDDPLAVVDQELRVIGVDGLRVVDASVMPDLIGGHLNAAVLMIAGKAADLIVGKPVRGLGPESLRQESVSESPIGASGVTDVAG